MTINHTNWLRALGFGLALAAGAQAADNKFIDYETGHGDTGDSTTNSPDDGGIPKVVKDGTPLSSNRSDKQEKFVDIDGPVGSGTDEGPKPMSGNRPKTVIEDCEANPACDPPATK